VKADDKTVAYLKKFRSDYIRCILNKKPDLLQPYYADDIRLMTVFQKTVIGKDNVLRYYQALSDRFDIILYDRKEIEILDLGKRVVEHGTFTMKMKSKITDTLHGKYQSIWERSDRGELSLITESWNYEHQLKQGEQLRFDEVPVVDVAVRPRAPVNNNVSFELAALNKLMEVTIIQHDSKIWAQFYSDEAILFANHHSFLDGRKAIDDYLEAHVNEIPVFEKLDIRNDRIDNLGDYVIEYASHIAIVKSGDWSGVGTGKDLRIWRRENDGSLKIFRHIGMYD
jgi:ketosteroid isomerase-like protein